MPQLTRIHKGSTGASGVQDKGLPVYTGAAQFGQLQVVLDPATSVSLGNPETITVTIVAP